MKSGIYVIDSGTGLIKIGRSSDIMRRLSQYKGYRDGELPKQYLLIYTKNHRYLEQQLHEFAEQILKRVNRLEIFKCDDKIEFISKLKTHVEEWYDCIDIWECPELKDHKPAIKPTVQNSADYFEQFRHKPKK